MRVLERPQLLFPGSQTVWYRFLMGVVFLWVTRTDMDTRRQRSMPPFAGDVETQAHRIKESGVVTRHVWIDEGHSPSIAQDRCQGGSIVGCGFSQGSGSRAIVPLWSI